MRLPTLSGVATSREMVDTFRGYNHNLRIGDGEAWDMRNMTSDLYPVLSPRKPRGLHLEAPITGIIGKEKLCYTEGTDFVIGDERYDLGLDDREKTMVSMGAFVIILPDKKYINTAQPEDRGDIENTVTVSGAVKYQMCGIDGAAFENTTVSDTEPENPANGAYWIDTSGETHALKRWAAGTSQWVGIATTYVKIEAPGIGTGFREHDGVQISGITAASLTDLNGTMTIWSRSDDWVVVIGFLDKAVTQEEEAVTVKRVMPIMDFVTESGNRLWGCRYGENSKGEFVNELYASRLGDFRNWESFMQVSTDSYMASVGTDGPFTGAVTHMGYPIFMKEDCFHKVYGSIPANFQIQTTACRGVQKGSHRSMAIVNEVLYYKSQTTVCAYDGSLPAEIGYCLGNVHYSNAVAGSHGNKYYISMMDLDGGWNLFVWDAAKKLWHREDDFRAKGFVSHGGTLYGWEDGRVWDMLNAPADADRVRWVWESGEIGLNMPDMKYINRLIVRMSLEMGTEVRVFGRYDFNENWEPLFALRSAFLKSYDVPLRPKRCDYMQLRIVGEGPGKIYSITRNIQQGSSRS